MNYPLVSEYIEAIKAAEDNFEQLAHLRPVLDDNGQPVMTSGNFAVVFKMKDEQTGKLHAVKCFLKEQEGRAEAYRHITEELEYVSSTFLTPIKYLDKELFVDANASDETEFPVLLMDWIEGQTLDKYIREHIDDEYELSLLAYQFSRLAMWLMPQPFAHGDLKPDNILVKEDGTLVLVDYDGMYVPAMKGQKARELGSPDFRHPSRTDDVFDEHIDDFSLASIFLSLKAIALQPSLLEEYGASDRLLFSEQDYRNLSECKVIKILLSNLQDNEIAISLSLFNLAVSFGNLSNISYRVFNFDFPGSIINYEHMDIDTGFSQEDNKRLFYTSGTTYSDDGIRLLRGIDNSIQFSGIVSFHIKEGTKIICDRAFARRHECLESIIIPNGVVAIGEEAFAFSGLKRIELPSSVVQIKGNPFYYCRSLKEITCLSNYFISYDNALYDKKLTRLICYYGSVHFNIPEGVVTVGEKAFAGCGWLWTIKLPKGLERIEENAFSECSSLKQITIPNSVTSIGEYAFYNNEKLEYIILPVHLKKISKGMCKWCSHLSYVKLYEEIANIGDEAFDGCHSLQTIELPQTLQSIGKRAFSGCNSIKSFSIPENVQRIGDDAFKSCSSLEEVFFEAIPKEIGHFPFIYCKSLRVICIPNGSLDQFAKLLPNNIEKLIEIDNYIDKCNEKAGY